MNSSENERLSARDQRQGVVGAVCRCAGGGKQGSAEAGALMLAKILRGQELGKKRFIGPRGLWVNQVRPRSSVAPPPAIYPPRSLAAKNDSGAVMETD